MTVLLFAHAAAAAKSDQMALDIPLPATIAECRAALVLACPALSEVLPTCAMAINCTVVGDDAMVTCGDEVAVLPPVSGG